MQLPDQSELPPRERIVTVPQWLPKYTLGWAAIEWIADNLKHPNGPRKGMPFLLTWAQTLFLLWFYAVDEDGYWLHNRAVRRLAKGSGKSPFAAVLALLELLGPVRVDYFDPLVPGGVVGKPVDLPLVQIAATSEKQTMNTMRMVRAMSNKRTALARKYGLDVGKTYIETPEGGRLEQITSSATAAEGAETSFTIADETEHWTPSNGGPDLAETLVQNAAKTGARLMETCNAWIPGIGSVAETVFDAWCAEQEAQMPGSTVRLAGKQTILYDARIAPPNTVMRDYLTEEEEAEGFTTLEEAGHVGISAALDFVYDDCFWVNKVAILSTIMSLAYPESRARRFYLNQPNAAEDAWVTVDEWGALGPAGWHGDEPFPQVADGDEVALFFDGSKSNDATALVGCRIEDGHVFTLGVWQPKPGEVVDTGAVDSAVIRAFKQYKVVAFFGDVREWESFVKVAWADLAKENDVVIWAVKHGKEPQPVAWDMRSHSYEFAAAAEMCLTEIERREFTHDGNWETSKHIGHARRTEYKGRLTIRKESPKSPKKIDAAVCVIGARMVRRLVLASPEWERRKTRGKWVVLS
ncbi:hypothetical protein ACFWGP_05410 [Agromyces sp. NPDC127015]|uniref:hypothetical protein n=1 Tax=Agromyces sp. NPDC127015 TaxID=3347108 RepID=UPI0036680B48